MLSVIAWSIAVILATGCGLLEPAPPQRDFKIEDLLLTNAEIPARIDYPPTQPSETVIKYGAKESVRMSWGTSPGIRYSVYRYIRDRFAHNIYQDSVVQPIDDLRDWTTVSLHANESNFRCDLTVNGHSCTLTARYEEFFVEVIFIAPKEVAKSDIDLVVRNMDARMARYLRK